MDLTFREGNSKKIGSAHAFPIVVLTIFKPNQKPITQKTYENFYIKQH